MFLFLLRGGGHSGHALQSYWVVLVSAAAVGIAAGAPWQSDTVTPGWAALGWLALTAGCSQICGWLMIGLVTYHLSSPVSSALLMHAASMSSSSRRRFMTIVKRAQGTIGGTSVR